MFYVPALRNALAHPEPPTLRVILRRVSAERIVVQRRQFRGRSELGNYRNSVRAEPRFLMQRTQRTAQSRRGLRISFGPVGQLARRHSQGSVKEKGRNRPSCPARMQFRGPLRLSFHLCVLCVETGVPLLRCSVVPNGARISTRRAILSRLSALRMTTTADAQDDYRGPRSALHHGFGPSTFDGSTASPNKGVMIRDHPAPRVRVASQLARPRGAARDRT
jgi:hypothetical protein